MVAPRQLTRRRSVERTGDDAPVATVWAFTWRMTGGAQILACVLSIIVTGLGLAPIELQRRLIDDAITAGDERLLLALAAIYLGVMVAQQVAKYLLRMLQHWLAESTVAYLRDHLWEIRRRAGDDDTDGISILTKETEALGAFAGVAPSKAVGDASMLLGALGYMFWVSPWVAAAGLVLLAPQAILAPLMQRRLNRLMGARLRLMRRYAAAVSAPQEESDNVMTLRLRHIFRNRMWFYGWKFLLKGGMNFLNALAPLGVLVVGGWLVIRGETTLGVIVAFTSGFARIGDPVRQLIAFYREASQGAVRHDMIAEWMRRTGV